MFCTLFVPLEIRVQKFNKIVYSHTETLIRLLLTVQEKSILCTSAEKRISENVTSQNLY